MSTETLTEWLLRQVADDEEVALAQLAAEAKWEAATHGLVGAVVATPMCMRPERLLAECEAKRRIVDAYEDERQRRDIYNRDYPLGLLTTEGDLRARMSSNARCAGLEIAVLALASVYADRPGYLEEWAPR